MFSVLTSLIEYLDDPGQDVEFTVLIITGDYWRQEHTSLSKQPSRQHLGPSAGNVQPEDRNRTGHALLATIASLLTLWICLVQLPRRQRPKKTPNLHHLGKKSATSKVKKACPQFLALLLYHLVRGSQFSASRLDFFWCKMSRESIPALWGHCENQRRSWLQSIWKEKFVNKH